MFYRPRLVYRPLQQIMRLLLDDFDAWVYTPSILILQPRSNLRPQDPEEAVSPQASRVTFVDFDSSNGQREFSPQYTYVY